MDSGTPQQIEEQAKSPAEELRRQRQILYGIIFAFVILLALTILAVYLLLQPTTDTARIRDVFIIFMAFESLLLGLVLVILIVQISRLINLLQNEIKPILESTNQTVSTLRGTTTFLSDNMVQPVIKVNEYVAGVQQALKTVGLYRGRSKKGKAKESE